MLSAAIRYKLHFGPYRTPRIKRGAVVEDEIRGEVTIVGLTNAQIPWPIGKKTKGKKSYVVCGGLAQCHSPRVGASSVLLVERLAEMGNRLPTRIGDSLA